MKAKLKDGWRPRWAIRVDGVKKSDRRLRWEESRLHMVGTNHQRMLRRRMGRDVAEAAPMELATPLR